MSMDVMKSIAPLRPCIIITFFFFFITILICMESAILDKHKEIVADLPKAQDLDKYLTALEKVVDFCLKHKVYVDLDMEFGLFLITVNMKHLVHEKHQSLPTKARYRMEQVLLKNDVLTDFFHYMVEKNSENELFQQDIAISKLFYNDSLWPSSLYKYNTDLLAHTRIYTAEELIKIYGKWENYEVNVYDFDRYRPTPNQSDECIAYLSNIRPTYNIRAPAICPVPDHCKEGVSHGSEFGYGFSHRILFMIIARFARGCSVFSAKEDKFRVDKYCIRTFNEVQYIAFYNCQLPDLMLEQIALCGLFGHAQFYRNSWLYKILEMQTSEGCFTDGPIKMFNEYMTEGLNEEWRINYVSKSVMGGRCNGHMTAVAAATYSAALRYIMETYY